MGNINWNNMYELSVEYYEQNKNLNLPLVFYYKGVNLGQWLSTQRKNYSKNLLSKDKIELLNRLHFEWENPRSNEYQWNMRYLLLKEYYNKYHHLFVPVEYKTENGINLGRWLYDQKLLCSKGKLSAYRIEMLNSLDISWLDTARTNTSFPEQAIMFYIKKIFPNAQKYKTKEISEIDIFIPELNIGIEYDGNIHQNLSHDIKKTEICKQYNINLIRVRERKCPDINDGSYIIKLPNESYITLEKAIKQIISYLGVSTLPKIDIKEDYFTIIDNYIKSIDNEWYEMFEVLKKYFEHNGNINVPANYVTEDGIRLGGWLSNIRNSKKNPDVLRTLTKEKMKMLNELGMDWNPFDTMWKEMYSLAKEFYKKNGNLLIPDTYLTKNNIQLGRWIGTQRKKFKDGILSKEYIELLNKIKMDWNPNENKWDIFYNYALDYFQKNKSLNMPNDYTVDGYNIASWIYKQRAKYQTKTLSDEKINKLEKIGMDWNPIDTIWREMYSLAKEFYEKNGNLIIPPNYEINNKKIGSWILKQRQLYKQNKLSVEKITDLNLIKMNWNPLEEQWEKMYNLAKEYYDEYKNLEIPKKYITKSGEKLGAWIGNQRYYRNKLDECKIRKLEDIGMIWKAKMDWDDFYKLAVEYYNKYGNVNLKCREEYNEIKLGWWLTNQKRRSKENKLTKDEKEKLERIKFQF